jgi:lipopolysaccharide heptosyltransferase II
MTIQIGYYGPGFRFNERIRYHRYKRIKADCISSILVVKLDHIGDVVLSLPAMAMLRRKYPNAAVTVLAGSWAKPIVEKLPFINDIITFDYFFERAEAGKRLCSPAELNRLEDTLKKRSFDLAVDLRRHPETRNVLKLSHARHTVGYCTGDDDWLSVCVRPSRAIADVAGQVSKMHITDQLCLLVRAIPRGFLSSLAAPFQRIQPPAMSPDFLFDEKREAEILGRHSWLSENGFFIGLHPGVGNPIRQWPVSYFARLTDFLLDNPDSRIVIFGKAEEEDIARRLMDLVKERGRIVSLVGKISLEEYMVLVRKCRAFIGNISGPAHIAAARGVPTLAIFGGQVLPHEWHPLGLKTLSVRLNVECAPCYKLSPNECPYGLKCLTSLSPDVVLPAVRRLLEGSPMSRSGQELSP